MSSEENARPGSPLLSVRSSGPRAHPRGGPGLEDLRAREESFVGRALLRGARGGELNAPAMPLRQPAVALRVVRVAQEPWTRFDRTLQGAGVIRLIDWFFHVMIMSMKVPAGVTFSNFAGARVSLAFVTA